jgi:thiamine biosynthesis lipoprotein
LKDSQSVLNSDPEKMRGKKAFLLIFLALPLWLCASVANSYAPKTRRYEDSRVSMGCVYTVVVYGGDLARLREAAGAALDEVDRIDRLMSHYKHDSELSRVNREAANSPVWVDPELFDFIAECLRYSRASEGAFDITVGPLMKAWGFFRGEGRMPGEAELAQARNRVGYQHVILNQKDGTIFFDRAGVELDLGGIAKGYAIDRAVAVLKRRGVASALLPMRNYTNGYRDLASEHRIGASMVPCHADYDFTRYKFDSRKYQPDLNKIIRKRVRKC